MKKKYKYLLIVFNILIFTILAILFKTNNIANFDNKIYELVTRYQNTYLTIFFKLITFLCSVYFITGIIIIIILTLKKNKLNLKITLNVLLCFFLNQILKHIIKRERPFDINLVKENGYSFPSGHSMVSLSFYGFFIYLINHKDYSKLKKIILSLLVCLLILLIGISRIYLGVQYASDVIAGFAISAAHLILYTMYYKKLG